MTKYKNKPTRVDNILFASKKEAARYQELRILAIAEKIFALELQPRFELKVNGEKVGTYIGDFKYYSSPRATSVVIEDVKGIKTPVYKLKKKLMKACYGIDITEV